MKTYKIVIIRGIEEIECRTLDDKYLGTWYNLYSFHLYFGFTPRKNSKNVVEIVREKRKFQRQEYKFKKGLAP